LIWFRKEPTLVWLEGPGETPEAIDCVARVLIARGIRSGDAP
jgi:hypothetical protein